MYPIGTRIIGSHGNGTIIGHNDRDDIFSLYDIIVMSLFPEDSMINAYADGKTFPYIVKWDDGYKDVYSQNEIAVAK